MVDHGRVPLPRVSRPRLVWGLRIASTVAVVLSAGWLALRTDLRGSVSAVGDLEPAMLAIAALATAAAVINRGMLHHQSRSLHGVACGLGTEIRLSAASLALNKVVKSGGLAGLTLYVRQGRRDGASTAAVTRAFVVVGAAAYVALAGLAIATIALVPRDDVPVAGTLSDMAFGAMGAVAVAVVATVFVTGIITSGSTLGIGRRSTSASRIVVHAGLNKLLGVVTLAAVLAAADAPVGVEMAVLVYTTALVGGALSIVPAGLGVVEVSTVAVLTAAGVEPNTAVAAVLAFRLFDLWIPVAIGWAMAIGLDAEPAGDETPILADGLGVPAPRVMAGAGATA